jgi:hypothetical protein
MYPKKKAQVSFEFSMIFVFILVLVSLSIYVFGYYLISLQDQKSKAERDDIAQSILEEFEKSQELGIGYKREITIPEYMMKAYNITANKSLGYLIVQDKFGNDNLYYYEILGDPNFNYTLLPSGEAKITIYSKPIHSSTLRVL